MYMAKLWDNLACEPFDPGSRRLGVDERITARVVVPAIAQHPHHRRHAGGSALAHGAASYSQSQIIRRVTVTVAAGD
jgi:hypothetical protein